MPNIKLLYYSKIRSVWNEEELTRFYSLNDVIKVLTNVKDAKNYLKDIRNRDKVLSKNWKKLVSSYEMDTRGGKQPVICANAEGLLRIIQSLRSPKAALFRRWLNREKNKK